MSQVLDEAELAWQKMQEAYNQANGENGHGDVEPPEGNTRSPARYIRKRIFATKHFILWFISNLFLFFRIFFIFVLFELFVCVRLPDINIFPTGEEEEEEEDEEAERMWAMMQQQLLKENDEAQRLEQIRQRNELNLSATDDDDGIYKGELTIPFDSLTFEEYVPIFCWPSFTLAG